MGRSCLGWSDQDQGADGKEQPPLPSILWPLNPPLGWTSHGAAWLSRKVACRDPAVTPQNRVEKGGLQIERQLTAGNYTELRKHHCRYYMITSVMTLHVVNFINWEAYLCVAIFGDRDYVFFMLSSSTPSWWPKDTQQGLIKQRNKSVVIGVVRLHVFCRWGFKAPFCTMEAVLSLTQLRSCGG